MFAKDASLSTLQRTQDGTDLLVVRVLHQSVKQDDALVLEKPIKVSVRVARTLATVNDKELGQWELDSTCQSLDHRTKFTLSERFDLVEERLDKRRVNGDHNKLERDPLWTCRQEKGVSTLSWGLHEQESLLISRSLHLHEQPNVEVKVFTANLDDLEEPCKEGHSNCTSDKVAFDEVAEKQSKGLLVESMTFFNDKGRVEREWHRDGGVEDGHQREEYDGLADLLFG